VLRRFSIASLPDATAIATCRITSWLLANGGELCSAAVPGDAPVKLPVKNRAMKLICRGALQFIRLLPFRLFSANPFTDVARTVLMLPLSIRNPPEI
jgi:hypothetical protein